jgi:hypothetical protein
MSIKIFGAKTKKLKKKSRAFGKGNIFLFSISLDLNFNT